jgi:hypothetical protein
LELDLPLELLVEDLNFHVHRACLVQVEVGHPDLGLHLAALLRKLQHLMGPAKQEC